MQGRSQQQGSYLSIDDMSFDPSIDDISSGFQRSSRSSLDGTSAASAADFSTLSVTPSHRYLSNEEAQAAAEEADAADEAEARSLSCASVISIDKEMKRDQFRISSSSSTITTTTTTTTAITKVTEYAVVHHQRSDVHNVNNRKLLHCILSKQINKIELISFSLIDLLFARNPPPQLPNSGHSAGDVTGKSRLPGRDVRLHGRVRGQGTIITIIVIIESSADYSCDLLSTAEFDADQRARRCRRALDTRSSAHLRAILRRVAVHIRCGLHHIDGERHRQRSRIYSF